MDDIDAARAELAGRGAGVSEVFHDAGGVFHHAGAAGRVAGPAPEHKSYGSWVSFADPDGNQWFVQEITTRLPGRVTSVQAAYDSVAGLAGALCRAAAAHGQHEEETGQPDPAWPDWYSQYMVDEHFVWEERADEYASPIADWVAGGYRAAAARGSTAAVMSLATDGGNDELEQ